MEEKACTLPQLTGGCDATNGEDLTDLTIFLDDAFAVQQAKSMFLYDLMIEKMCQLFFCHTLTSILNSYLHILIRFCSRHLDFSTFLRKLTGIVGKGIQHKQRQHLICFHH